ncbi:hypothetical protein R6Z07F_005520 [Ovis aries]
MAQVRDGAEMEPLCRPSLWAVGAMSGAQGAGVCLQQHQGQVPAETAPTGRPQTPALRDRSLTAPTLAAEHSQYHSLVRWQFPEKQEGLLYSQSDQVAALVFTLVRVPG